MKVKGIFLKEGERIGQIDPETGLEKLDNLEDERVFDASQIERDITSPDSNNKILEEFKKYALSHEERYGRFPKTLIFAQKITGSPTVDRPLQRIREFRNRPKPGIAVTVDMLSTGVDIPSLEFIIFMRPVRSRILFEQMMGRGTRRCDEIGKSHFVVFDCFGGTLLEYFKDVSAFTIDPPIKPTRPIKDIIEDIYQNKNRDYNIRVLVKRLQRISKEMPGEAIDLFSKFIPEGDVKSFAKKEEPLFTAEERVERAFEKITMKTDYSEEKKRWLELIKNHLIENLTIDKGDFDKIPAFTRIGGWNVANRIFGNQLESLLHTINTEMAAA